MKFLLCLIFSSVVLAGCYTENKARSQFGKAVAAFPLIAPEYCAEHFPVKTKTDSTGYKESLAAIDTLKKRLAEDSLLNDQEREKLNEEIKRIRDGIKEPENCDSLAEGIYRLAAKEKQRGDKLQKAYDMLLVASQNVKPIRDTIESTSGLKACELKRDAINELLIKKTAEANKWEGRAKKYLWIIVGLGALLLLIIILLIRRKVKK